jgi:hypothetical protein
MADRAEAREGYALRALRRNPAYIHHAAEIDHPAAVAGGVVTATSAYGTGLRMALGARRCRGS